MYFLHFQVSVHAMKAKKSSGEGGDEATKKRSKGRLQVDTRGTRTKFLNKGKEQI